MWWCSSLQFREGKDFLCLCGDPANGGCEQAVSCNLQGEEGLRDPCLGRRKCGEVGGGAVDAWIASERPGATAFGATAEPCQWPSKGRAYEWYVVRGTHRHADAGCLQVQGWSGGA